MFQKTLSLSDAQLKFAGDESLSFSGYASVFKGYDTNGDTILPGAYALALKASNVVKLYYNHGWLRKELPIGRATVGEDEYGLKLDGELTKGLALAESVRVAMKHQTVDGLSVGFEMKRDGYEKTDNGRIIKQIDRLIEVSIVDFPSDGMARVDTASVKYEDISGLETVRDFERFLRDVGLDQAVTKALVTRAKIVFASRDGLDEIDAKAAAELRRLLDTPSLIG